MIYPQYIKESAPNSEKKLFEALSCLPSNDFTIFYNQEFIREFSFKENFQYEIDFIIIDHRDGVFKSLLVLEVKGGNIQYNSVQDQWLQNKIEMKKSPVSQVTGAMHSFLKRFYNLLNNVNVSWGVAFPDVTLDPQSKYPSQLPFYKIFDSNKISRIEDSLIEYFDDTQLQLGRSGNSIEKLNLLKDHLLVDCDFYKPLHIKNEENNNVFIKLTQQQSKILKAIDLNQNVVVQGPAGSGKTLLAYQKAVEFKECGQKVLYVTFNKAIASHLRNRLKKESLREGINEYDNQRNLDITNFHFWSKRLAEQNPTFKKEKGDNEYFNTYIPNKAIESLKNNSSFEKYDVIIVDEGQDFRTNWLELLNKCLKSDGRFMIFMDENQNIFNAFTGVPNRRNFTKLILEENCRNTKSIINFLTEIITVDLVAMENSPIGEPVEYRVFHSNEDQLKYLDEQINLLLNREQIQPKDIIIIVNNTEEGNTLGNIKTIGGLPLKSSYDKSFGRSNDAIFYTYINTFKGLESEVVFIIDSQNIDNRFSFYTQASRAKNKLYITKINY